MKKDNIIHLKRKVNFTIVQLNLIKDLLNGKDSPYKEFFKTSLEISLENENKKLKKQILELKSLNEHIRKIYQRDTNHPIKVLNLTELFKIKNQKAGEFK